MEKFSTSTEKRAYMSCHFSPSGYGLSNLPGKLPENTMLILDDSTPVNGHDSSLIADAILKLEPECVLLDFQRMSHQETAAMAEALVEMLPCPVGVSAVYADTIPCPIFLPPVPTWMQPEEYLKQWAGRDIWLELSTDTALAQITESGTEFFYADTPPEGPPAFHSAKLLCHYCGLEKDDHVDYWLWRTADDCRKLAEQASAYGMKAAVGVYQQFYL